MTNNLIAGNSWLKKRILKASREKRHIAKKDKDKNDRGFLIWNRSSQEIMDRHFWKIEKKKTCQSRVVYMLWLISLSKLKVMWRHSQTKAWGFHYQDICTTRNVKGILFRQKEDDALWKVWLTESKTRTSKTLGQYWHPPSPYPFPILLKSPDFQRKDSQCLEVMIHKTFMQFNINHVFTAVEQYFSFFHCSSIPFYCCYSLISERISYRIICRNCETCLAVFHYLLILSAVMGMFEGKREN